MSSEKGKSPARKRRIQSPFIAFLTTIKERKIIHALAAFIGGGWFIYEIVHWILVDHYHFPEQFLDITIVTLLCFLICTLTWQWFRGIEKRRRIKAELIIIPLFILATGYLDVRFIQHIGKPEPESVSESLPENSIAVLPFANMSGDPGQEYFSDGLTEEIITALSNIPKLFVIARQSTFAYKGKPVKVRQVSEELGVRYVLEGSVRRSGDRVRIMAQLIDAQTGLHLWAERYDRELKDIFALQDEITVKILTSLQVKLTEGESARAFGRGTDNVEAYLKLVQAREQMHRLNKDDNIIARRMVKEVIALDPKYARAYTVLGFTHFLDVVLGLSKSPRQSFKQAMELAQRAIVLDDSLISAHNLLAYVYSSTRQYEKGIAEGERAVALGPSSASAHNTLGMALRYAGRWEEAIPVYEKAIRLNPLPRSLTFWHLGLAYLYTGRSEEAIVACKKAVDGNPNNLSAHLALTVAYSDSGREEEARATAKEVLRIDPKFSVDNFAKRIVTYKNQADRDRYIDALRKAGLK